jgi:hypothetical protein
VGGIALYSFGATNVGLESLIVLGTLAAWTALMSNDFFVVDMASRRPILYSMSHLFVTVLIVGWIATALLPSALTSGVGMVVGAIALYMLLVTTALEILRKTFVNSEDLTEGDSYSRTFGFNRSLITAGLLALAATMVDSGIFLGLDLRVGVAVVASFCTGKMYYLYQYHKEKSAQIRKIAVTVMGFELIASSLTTFVAMPFP